ncbi:hypothetical protein INT45_001297 [Circinella minor]|uniref:NodB homology domain-containing protein n=1 Tax=Circinella minor TaxID=1195481 RepID=A0A8H7S7H5_9FUNG|nr:hypothetical protein INT45_001297 [Circinella minor]
MYLTISLSSTLLFTLTAVATSATNDEQVQHQSSDSSQTSPYLAVSSPAWLADIKTPFEDARSLALSEEDIMVRPLEKVKNLQLTNFPPPMRAPPVDDPEVQAVIKQLDWSQVPDAPVRTATPDGELNVESYNSEEDPHCWWSSTLCKTPKVNYIPEDISYCPRAGDWGLNYDDGPYRVWSDDENEKEYEEPRLYNFLIEQGKLKATLFYIGSNVMTFPEAAQRAFSDGHTICSHTWSHPYMTTLTNEQIVSELYWTQKAIKEAVGVTPKCWRPPFGDIDDRVRAIAWQMGMRSILWDRDSNDWALAAQSISANTVNGYFKEWVELRAADQDNEHGHIPLQHESSNHTIMLTEKWLPNIQKQFNIVPIHECIGDSSPYWEDGPWEYKSANKIIDEANREQQREEEEDENESSNSDSDSSPNSRIAIGSNNNKTLSKEHQNIPGTPSSGVSLIHSIFIDSTLLFSFTFAFIFLN